MVKNIDVRFFTYAWDAEGDESDIYEITESQFEELTLEPYSEIYYKKNTVHDNGVRQIVLTIDPLSYRDYLDLDLVEA